MNCPYNCSNIISLLERGLKKLIKEIKKNQSEFVNYNISSFQHIGHQLKMMHVLTCEIDEQMAPKEVILQPNADPKQ